MQLYHNFPNIFLMIPNEFFKKFKNQMSYVFLPTKIHLQIIKVTDVWQNNERLFIIFMLFVEILWKGRLSAIRKRATVLFSVHVNCAPNNIPCFSFKINILKIFQQSNINHNLNNSDWNIKKYQAPVPALKLICQFFLQ